MIADLTTYMGSIYKAQCTRQLHGMYKCRTRLCATAGRLRMVQSATVGHCQTGAVSVGTSARRHCLLSTSDGKARLSSALAKLSYQSRFLAPALKPELI